MKKLLSLVLALVMVLSLVACAKTEAPKADAPAADAPAADAPAADAPAADAPAADAELDPIVLSMNVLDAEKHGNHARNEYVKEKFNLTFDYIPVSWGDWNEKVQTWIATDDAPDLINWLLTPTCWTSTRPPVLLLLSRLMASSTPGLPTVRTPRRSTTPTPLT